MAKSSEIPPDATVFVAFRSPFERGAPADRRAPRRSSARGAPSRADYGPVFDHLDVELLAVEAELTDAESAYQLAEVRAFDLRKQRDHAATDLREQHTFIERFCRSQPQLEGADVVGPAPRATDALARQVSVAVEFLRELDRSPQRLVAGVRIDAGVLADDLEAGLPRLKAASAAFAMAESDVVVARERANWAFAEAGEVLSWVARTLDSLSGLAGEERLAGRIRRCGG